jgi:hypothetical protein
MGHTLHKLTLQCKCTFRFIFVLFHYAKLLYSLLLLYVYQKEKDSFAALLFHPLRHPKRRKETEEITYPTMRARYRLPFVRA